MSIPFHFDAIPSTLHLVGLSDDQYKVAIALISFDTFRKGSCFPSMPSLSRKAMLPVSKEGTGREECRRLRKVLDELRGLGLIAWEMKPVAKKLEEGQTARRTKAVYDISPLIKRCVALQTTTEEKTGAEEEEGIPGDPARDQTATSEVPRAIPAPIPAPLPVQAPTLIDFKKAWDDLKDAQEQRPRLLQENLSAFREYLGAFLKSSTIERKEEIQPVIEAISTAWIVESFKREWFGWAAGFVAGQLTYEILQKLPALEAPKPLYTQPLPVIETKPQPTNHRAFMGRSAEGKREYLAANWSDFKSQLVGVLADFSPETQARVRPSLEEMTASGVAAADLHGPWGFAELAGVVVSHMVRTGLPTTQAPVVEESASVTPQAIVLDFGGEQSALAVGEAAFDPEVLAMDEQAAEMAEMGSVEER